MLAEKELLPPDPEPPDSEVPEPDVIEGLSLRMTQAMNQWEECHCFMCRATDHLAWDCPHGEAFHAWHKEHLNSKGAGPQPKVPTPKSPPWKYACKWLQHTTPPHCLWMDQLHIGLALRPWWVSGLRVGRSMLWQTVVVR